MTNVTLSRQRYFPQIESKEQVNKKATSQKQPTTKQKNKSIDANINQATIIEEINEISIPTIPCSKSSLPKAENSDIVPAFPGVIRSKFSYFETIFSNFINKDNSQQPFTFTKIPFVLSNINDATYFFHVYSKGFTDKLKKQYTKYFESLKRNAATLNQDEPSNKPIKTLQIMPKPSANLVGTYKAAQIQNMVKYFRNKKPQAESNKEGSSKNTWVKLSGLATFGVVFARIVRTLPVL